MNIFDHSYKLYKIYKKLPILNKIRLIWGVAILLIVLVFLWLKILPFGRASYLQNYDQAWRSGKGFIYNFTPLERVTENEGAYPRIIGDPAYFSVFTPRTFSKARLTVTYKDKLKETTPIIEAGVLADKLAWHYELRPLENKILDRLEEEWFVLEVNGLKLLQEKNNYQSQADFLEDLKRGHLLDCPKGPTTCLAGYNHQPEFDFYLPANATNTSNGPEGSKPNAVTEINIPLRGTHVLLVYLDDHNLYFDLEFVDLNQDPAPDPLQLSLFRGSDLIAYQELLDENLRPTSGQAEQKNLALIADALLPGLYRLEIKISDDVVIKNIKSSAARLVFAHKFWPVSYGGEISIFTDSPYLLAKVSDPANLQTIAFGQETFKLTSAYQQTELLLKRPQAINRVRLSKDDIILENNGVFALSADALFNPLLKKVDRYFSPSSDIKYVLADYEAPLIEDDWKQAQAELNLKGVYRDKGKYNFAISIPGLKAEDEIEDYLEIKEVKIEFYGRNLLQRIFNL